MNIVQLNLISESPEEPSSSSPKAVGTFPFHIGRAASCEFQIEAPGVWDRHARILVDYKEGFRLEVLGEARATVNDETVTATILRNGDIIGVGSCKVQFSLSPTKARSLRWREIFLWAGLALLCLGEIALMYWLPG